MTNREKRSPKRLDVYEEFLLWSAMPPGERARLGTETQEQFADRYKVGINTPTAWKRRPDFVTRVTAIRTELAFERTGDVIDGIYQSALKGNSASQTLWLKYFSGIDNTQSGTLGKPDFFSMDDIKMLIEALPEDKRDRHYNNVSELVSEVQQLSR